MPIVKFFGKIEPSNHYKTSLMSMPPLRFKSGDGSLEAELTITVTNSEVEVTCVMPTYTKDNFSLLHKVAYDYTRASINLVMFSTGLSFSVFFDRMMDEHGTHSAFIIQHHDLAKLCTTFSVTDPQPNPALNEVISVVMSEPALFLALDDLVTSASFHHLLVVNAARSVEGLRHAIAAPGMSRDQEWENFRSILNVDKKYLSLITDHSKSGRHGEATFIPGNITEEISTRAWTIFNRVLALRKNGNKRLSIVDFPMLTG